MKKKSHISPMEYRVEYRVDDSARKSTQYYNVYHSSEALEFFAHTFRKGHVHGERIYILKVEEYNRYGDKWEDRTDKAIEHAEILEMFPSEEGNPFLEKV
jgi:hypothetical protein